MTCRQQDIEEPVPAGRCANPDFPELALDLPELCPLRVEPMLFDFLEDRQNGCAIQDGEIPQEHLKITSSGSRGCESYLHALIITRWIYIVKRGKWQEPGLKECFASPLSITAIETDLNSLLFGLFSPPPDFLNRHLPLLLDSL